MMPNASPSPAEIPTLEVPYDYRTAADTDPQIMIEGCETFMQAHTTLDRLIEEAVVAGEDLVAKGLSPADIIEVMPPLLDAQSSAMQDWIREKGPFGLAKNHDEEEVIMRGELAGGETIQSFRLRLKALSYTQEALWRTLTLFPADDPNARQQRQIVQSQLAIQYAKGLDLIKGKRRFFIDIEHECAARQEVSVALLLSLTPTPQGAYFISSFVDDMAGKDGVLWYYTAYRNHDENGIDQRLKKEPVQIKSSPTTAQLNQRYLSMTIVDAFATGNLGLTCPDHVRRYEWRTASALHRAMYSNRTLNEREPDVNYIYSLLFPSKDDEIKFIDRKDFQYPEVSEHDTVHQSHEAYLRNSRNVISWLNTLLWPFKEEATYGNWAWEDQTSFCHEDLARRLNEIKAVLVA